MIARKPQTAAPVALRPLCQNDLPRVRRWRTDPQAARFCGWDRPEFAHPSCVDGLYLPAIMDPEGADAWHFVIESDDGPIGLVSYDRVDRYNASARVSILIGERNAWGRGLGAETLRRVLALLFGPGGFRRVWTEVNAQNERALRCFARCGFREEGRQREAELFEGHWTDTITLSLLVNEWERRMQPTEYETTPLREDEREWFAARSHDAGCDPFETNAALSADEIIVWRLDGCPAGVASLEWRAREVEIHILGVDPAFRRRGLATRMLQSVRDMAERKGIRRIRLLTSNDNLAALILYQRTGFRILTVYTGRPERRRGYVRMGHNGIPVRDDIDMVWDF
ncbi:MAG TPA: GNAT family N-acetyltransferase [Armatimonadota bacterium]|jgi:RimJ/RimL family protein N-acetyltransferase